MADIDAWMEQAEEDLHAADVNLEQDLLSHAAFFYQQAAEKALKYALLKMEKTLVKTHDCFVLATKADAPEHILSHADTITPFYFRTRYPDAGAKVTKEETVEVQTASQEVVAWVKKRFLNK